jgi:primosomal protein N'
LTCHRLLPLLLTPLSNSKHSVGLNGRRRISTELKRIFEEELVQQVEEERKRIEEKKWQLEAEERKKLEKAEKAYKTQLQEEKHQREKGKWKASVVEEDDEDMEREPSGSNKR